MARCGRCGLWLEYPEDHKEQKYKGVCLWFHTRLSEDEVFESRECREGFERIPGMTPAEHFEHKVKREDIGHAYTEAKRAKYMAYLGLVVGLAGLLITIVKFVSELGE